MFKNIIIAVDGSEYSHKAIKCAKSIAESFEANLWLVHAFSNPSDFIGYTDYEKLFAKRKAAAQAVLDDAQQKLGRTSLDINAELREGSEAESILKEAKKCNADLIVMGTRGHGTLKGFLVGSVSRKVIHYAVCPVLVVH